MKPLRGLLPFAVLIAVWWGIKIGAEVPDKLLATPQAVWTSFVGLVSHGILLNMPARACV